MFNRGAFNRMPFNRDAQTGDDWYDEMDMSARFNAAVLTGGNLHDLADMPAQYGARASGGAGVRQAADLAATVSASAWARMDFKAADSMAAALSMSTRACLNLHPPAAMAATVHAAPRAGMNAHTGDDLQARVLGRALQSRNYHAPLVNLAAIFGCQVTTIRFDVLTALLDITVPPGSTLVIDSNGYVVLLDGDDVIWAHTGDWLHLNRNTYDITFDILGGASADRQILYTERWL